MSTVAQLIDRCYREFLTPPTEQPARATLAAAITTTSATTFTVDTSFLTPEEEDLFGPGTIIEIDSELIEVGAYDTDTNTASACKRGILGTTAATHLLAAYATISPRYARKALFDAIADGVVDLWPTLYAVTQSASLSFSSTTYTEIAATVIEPMYVWARPNGSTFYDKYDAIQFLDNFTPSSTGKAVRSDQLGDGATGYLVYKAKFVRPTLESDDLVATCLIQAEWERIVEVGAVAHLAAGGDLSEQQQDFLVQQLQTQNYPVLTPTRIRESLLKYYEYLLERAQKPLRERQDATLIRYTAI